MNDDPSSQTAGPAHGVVEVPHRGERQLRAGLVVHARYSTTRRRSWQALDHLELLSCVVESPQMQAECP